MRTSLAFLLFLSIADTAVAGPDVRDIAVLFEPEQRKVDTVRVRSERAAAAPAVMVRLTSGILRLPPAVEAPASIDADGFEPATYTTADARGGRPIVLRSLGTLTGKLVRRSVAKATFTLLLRKTDAREPTEVELTVGANQSFSLQLPAGVYQGAVLGDGLASHILAAIVIKPGETTVPRPIQLEPAIRATFRVLDHTTAKPIGGARVAWSPPAQELNASSSRLLFSKRWSGVTDADGRVSFPSVGPAPIPVRWRIEAPLYPPAHTPATQLRADGRLALADARLKRPSILTVRILGPRRGDLPAGTLVLLAATSEDAVEYRRETSAPLKAGETIFRGVTYGPKRIQVVGKSGETLLYDDFRIESENAAIEVTMEPVELFGTVTRGTSAVSDASVVFSDPVDPSVYLVKTTTNFLGRYRATTWKRGRLFGYAIEYSGPGKVSGNAGVEATIGAASREHEANFSLPDAGLTVVVFDAVTNEPIPGAQVDRRIRFRDGSGSMGRSETDARGRLELANYQEGTAKLFVQAKGYRMADPESPIVAGAQTELRIALQPARTIAGRVVGPDGMPVPGALVQGGYPGERAVQATFETRTDSAGSFAFDSAPMVGTPFYVMAPGYALTTTTLRAGDGNVIRLDRPSNGNVYVTANDGAPLQKVYRMVAAPTGGAVVPIGALDDLARINGLTQFQLLGTGRDGSSILAEFLGAGSWDLFITKRGGDPYLLERIGTVETPVRGARILMLRE